MAYHLAYAFADRDDIVEGDEVASGSGWAAFSEWADALDESWPRLGYLGEHGGCFPREGLAELESELERALAEKPGDPDEYILGVGRTLLAAIRDRPADADAVAVTDGTDGVEDDDEDGE